MQRVEMSASAVTDVQEYYDLTDPVRASLWRRAVSEGRVAVLPDPEEGVQ